MDASGVRRGLLPQQQMPHPQAGEQPLAVMKGLMARLAVHPNAGSPYQSSGTPYGDLASLKASGRPPCWRVGRGICGGPKVVQSKGGVLMQSQIMAIVHHIKHRPCDHREIPCLLTQPHCHGLSIAQDVSMILACFSADSCFHGHGTPLHCPCIALLQAQGLDCMSY